MKEKLQVPSRIWTHVSPLESGVISTTPSGQPRWICGNLWRWREIEYSQSTGHFSFKPFVCIMAKSWIKFWLRDRQKFSRAKKALQNTERKKLPCIQRGWPDGVVDHTRLVMERRGFESCSEHIIFLSFQRCVSKATSKLFTSLFQCRWEMLMQY